MSENIERMAVKKRGNFWFIVGGGIVLFTVYQLGYSAGMRVALESRQDVRAVMESSSVPVSMPVLSSENAGTKPQPVKVAKPSSPPAMIETESLLPPAATAVVQQPLPVINPSALGLMPLERLESISESLKVPMPVYADTLPAMRSSPAVPNRPAASLFPMRITSSSECDCGKSH